MKRFVFCLVAGALTMVSSAEAQRSVAAKDVPPGQRPPRGMCRVWIDGLRAGRQPAPTDCATARANAPANSRVIYGDLTPFPGQARGRTVRDCSYERTTTTVGDIIFGRRSADRDVECRNVGTRQLGAWYEVGRDANGNVIYQRRVRLADGTIALQRARRASNGSLVVFDTRYPRASRGDDDGDDDRRWSRAERRAAKQARKAQKRASKAAVRTVREANRAEERALREANRAEERAARAAGNSRGKGRGNN